jgi:hypothetical protein
MKTNIKNLMRAFLLGGVLLTSAGCNTEPEYFSQVVPETFLTTKDAVWQRYCRPFTHWKWFVATNRDRYDLMELGTDEICIPTRNTDWYNGGLHQNQHHHIFEYTEGVYHNGFYGVGMGIALAWDAIEDIQTRVDLEKVGITKEEQELMIAQLNILVANLYKDGLDLFGGMPLYGLGDKELKARSTDVETFNFIEKLILDNIDKLKSKDQLGATETSYIHKGWAAVNLAQLYFNAEAYTKGQVKKYAEAAKVCEDIIAGKYGKYALATDWTNIFGYGNENCPELIYAIPSDATYSGCNSGFFPPWFCYNTNAFFGGVAYGNWNGFGIQPSRKPDGTKYTESDWKLGRVMDKFEDSDVRKHMYTYEGGGKYHGLFLMGYQVNPSKNNPGGDKNWVALGGREYKGSIIYLSDCVARFALDGGVKAWNEKGEPLDADGKVMDRSQFSKLPSTIATGEEASLYRLLKRCPPVDILEYNNMRMRHPSMTPIARLTEVYYMLAECYLRDEKKEDAAKLINQVRARYFEGGKDPNPVTAANLDKYRMLDEWMIEFLGEARRRTDLIRWDAYVTEKWWDHEPSNNKNWERFPISEKSLASNNLLVQNPGY